MPHRVYVPVVRVAHPSTSAPSGPTDQELIAAALADGRIDQGTALLYRAYALFGDDRLPQAFWGVGSQPEDNHLWLDTQVLSPTLSADMLTQLRPYLTRPTDPLSVYNTPQPVPQGSLTPAAEVVPCANGWASMVNDQSGLKVWACRTDDYHADLQQALALTMPIYESETALMGPPKADVGEQDEGSSNHIDLYLLDPLQSVRRRGDDNAIQGHTAAAAAISPPFTNTTGTHSASGYMLLNRQRLRDNKFRSDFAHEFFHILQYNHNYQIGSGAWRDRTTGKPGKPSTGVFWWDEASAEWAASHFARPTAWQHVHPRFTTTFQTMDVSLHAPLPTTHAYAAYIWPFFLEQENGAKAISRIWDVLRTVEPGDWDGAMEVINTEYPFAQHFHRFALRNLNYGFDGDDPLPKRYEQLDPQFPGHRLPQPVVDELLPARTAADPPLQYRHELVALRSHPYHFRLAPDVKQVTFSFGNLVPQDDRKVGAVVKIKGKPWEYREQVPDQLHFCRNNPEEDLEDIWFVVSNHQRDISAKVTGVVEARPLKEPCTCNPEVIEQVQAVKQWKGVLTFSYMAAGTGNDYSIRQERMAHITTTLEPQPYAEQSFIGNPSGSGTINDQKYFKDKLQLGVAEIGLPIPYDPASNNWSRVTLNFNWERCQYNWGASMYLNAMITAHNTPTRRAPWDIGTLHSNRLPLTGLELSGTDTFPAHSQEYILSHGGAFYDQPDYDLIRILGEDGLGVANVTWRFTPVVPPPDQ
jgi:hypothetical protein